MGDLEESDLLVREFDGHEDRLVVRLISRVSYHPIPFHSSHPHLMTIDTYHIYF